jgi:hypothetical protein
MPPPKISSLSGFDSGRPIVETRAAWTVPAAERLLIYFCELMPSVILLVFLLVSAAIGD